MPFKSFDDFTYRSGPDLLPSDYLVGYRDLNNEFRTKIEDISIELLKNIDLNVSPQVLYVNTNGKDTNSGKSDFNAFRTIKRAAAKALEISRKFANLDVERTIDNEGKFRWGVAGYPVNIFVRAGDYIEDNPIYLPPCVTLIGDNLRSASIIPKNKFYDIIWVNHRCYVWGFTFRQHKYPSYAIAYPDHQYIQGAEQSDFYTTRMSTATARAEWFYNNYREDLPSNILYDATRDINDNFQNLSIDSDSGAPIFNPAQIAFLSRYYKNLNDEFFRQDETDESVRFDETEYHKANIRRAYSLTSPYPQGNSSITKSSSKTIYNLLKDAFPVVGNGPNVGPDDAGGGVLVDGFKVDGPTRSMVMDSFTQFNEGGKGIHIINNGYAQLVSTFTICCTEGVICETGGTCSINTSNCSFGLTGLAAYGKSPKPTLIGQLKNPINTLTNIISIKNLSAFASEQQFPNDFQPYPGQVFEIVVDPPEGSSLPPLTANNNGSMFSMLSCQRVIEDFTNDTYFCDLVLDTNYSPFLDTSVAGLASSNFEIPVNSKVYFYIRSTITTSAHTMEYIGTGTTLLEAVPQKGGQTDVTKEVSFDTIGRVFYTSTNQFGDFRIGNDLTIVQATGTIEGETFERSILTIVTPFTIAIATSL